MLKYGESSLHSPKHYFPHPNQGNTVNIADLPVAVVSHDILLDESALAKLKV